MQGCWWMTFSTTKKNRNNIHRSQANHNTSLRETNFIETKFIDSSKMPLLSNTYENTSRMRNTHNAQIHSCIGNDLNEHTNINVKWAPTKSHSWNTHCVVCVCAWARTCPTIIFSSWPKSTRSFIGNSAAKPPSLQHAQNNITKFTNASAEIPQCAELQPHHCSRYVTNCNHPHIRYVANCTKFTALHCSASLCQVYSPQPTHTHTTHTHTHTTLRTHTHTHTTLRTHTNSQRPPLQHCNMPQHQIHSTKFSELEIIVSTNTLLVSTKTLTDTPAMVCWGVPSCTVP